MKKGLIPLTLLALASMVLVGCDKPKGGSSQGGSSGTDSSQTSGSSESGSSEVVNVNYGTAEAPLTLAEAKTEVAKLNLENNKYSAQHFFLKGKLVADPVAETGNNEGRHSFSLTDDTNTLEVGHAVIASLKAYKDDELVLKTYLRAASDKDYGYRATYNSGEGVQDPIPTGMSITHAAATLDVTGVSDKVTVAGLPESYKNADKVEFTVAVKSEYEASWGIGDVKVGETALQKDATTGKYSFEIHGAMALTVAVVDISSHASSVTITAAGSATSVRIGETLQLSAVVVGDEGVSQSVVWSSADDTKATVDASGLVTPVAVAAEVIIRATAVAKSSTGEDVVGEYTLAILAKHGTTIDDPLTGEEAHEIGVSLGYGNVSEDVYYVSGIATSFYNENTPYLDYSKFEIAATNEAWGESKVKLEKGALVVAHGNLYSGGAGFTKINGTPTIDSVDNSKIRLIEISGERTVEVDGTTTLTKATFPASVDTSAGSFVWSSKNTAIATVTDAGVVTGEAVGDTEIEVSYIESELIVAKGTFSIGVELPQIIYKTVRFGPDGDGHGTTSGTAGYGTADTPAVWTYTSTDGLALTLTNFNNNTWKNNWKWVKCGSKNYDSTASIVTPSLEEAVTKMEITIDAFNSSKLKTFKVFTASNADFTTDVQTFDLTIATGINKVAVNTPANSFIKIEVSCGSGGSSNGFVTISGIDLYKLA